MAIRIRVINGRTVALCANKTKEMPGDLYLDDNVHHALSTKFGLDWVWEGLLEKSLADPELKAIILESETDPCIVKINDEVIHRKAIKHFGKNTQMGVLQEECAELIQAISKHVNRKIDNVENIMEEIAHVDMLLDTMKLIFDKNKIEAYKREAIERFKSFLESLE